MSTTWFMIRPVIGLSLLAAPASALTCSEYERIGRDAVDRVREDTACHDMSSDAWSSCMTAAFLAGEPSVVAFMEMMQGWSRQPEFLACNPDQPSRP